MQVYTVLVQRGPLDLKFEEEYDWGDLKCILHTDFK